METTAVDYWYQVSDLLFFKEEEEEKLPVEVVRGPGHSYSHDISHRVRRHGHQLSTEIRVSQASGDGRRKKGET
jgi:hypothetical protein